MAAPAPWRSLPPAQTEDLGEIEDADPFGSAATAAPPPHATAAPPAAGQEIEDEDPFGSTEKKAPQTRAAAYGAAATQGVIMGAGSAISGVSRFAQMTGPRLAEQNLAAMDKIDKGQHVSMFDDPLGYQGMNESQRAATRREILNELQSYVPQPTRVNPNVPTGPTDGGEATWLDTGEHAAPIGEDPAENGKAAVRLGVNEMATPYESRDLTGTPTTTGQFHADLAGAPPRGIGMRDINVRDPTTGEVIDVPPEVPLPPNAMPETVGTRLGERISQYGKETFPVAPEQEGVGTGVARMAGGMLPIVLGAAGATAVGAPAAGAALIGATIFSQGYDSTYHDATAHGATPEQADRAALENAAAQAATMSVPVGRLLSSLPAPLRDGALRTLVNMGQHGVEFGGFNAMGQFINNYVANQSYDPTRPLTEGVAESGLEGLITGIAIPAGAAFARAAGDTLRTAAQRLPPRVPPPQTPGAAPEPPPAAPPGPEPSPAAGPAGIGGPSTAPGTSPPPPGPAPRPRPARLAAAQPTPASAADTEAAVAAGQPAPAPTPPAPAATPAAAPATTPIAQARAGAVQGWIDQISTGIAGGVKSEGDRIVLQGALGQLQASVGKPGGATPEQVAQAKAALEGDGQSGTPAAATPVPPTVPEPAADIHAQVAALADPKNPKDAVFLAAGTPLPSLPTIDGLHVASRPEGTLLTTNPTKADLYRNAAAISDPLMAHLLGYPETKPEVIASGNPVVVQGTDPAGAVVAETLASPQGIPAAEAAVQAQTPKGGDVTVRPPQEVTDERAQETAAEGQMPAVQQTAVQRAAQDYASRATDEAYRGGIPWMEAQSAGAEAYVEYMEGTAEFPAGMRDLVNPDTGVDSLLREYERAMESGASPQQAARHAVDMAEAGKGAFAPPQAANDLRPSPQPAAPTRVRSIDEIVTQDGVKEPKARQIQNAEMLAVGRPITMDEMAARRAGVAALPSSVPGVPPLQPSEPRDQGYPMFKPSELTIDPAVMQFKASDEKGVTGALTGFSKWEPMLANPITVWQANDGRNVIVNGHQRLDLAQRAEAAGQQGVQLPARVYREADGYTPEYMRALGAYQNIAEGSGTPLDAARVLRTKNAFPDSMRLPELPPHQMIVQQARGLANLSPEAFGAVENGLVPPEYAGMVGAVISEPAEQMAALDALARAHPENANQARINIADIRNGGFLQGAQTTLFGEEAFARSLVPERAKVLDGAMKILRSAAAAFRATVKGEKTLTDAGNVLATDANVQGKTASERLLDTIGRNATTVGPYSDALNVAARALAAGKPSDVGKIAHSFLAAARELERGGARAGVPAGDHGRGIGHEGEGEQGAVADARQGFLEVLGRLAQPPSGGKPPERPPRETEKTMPRATGAPLAPGVILGNEAEGFSRFAQENPGIPHAALAGQYVLERGRATGKEYIAAYDAGTDSVVLVHTDDQEDIVDFPPGFAAIAYDPTRTLVVHHNHPGSNSLSPKDIANLAFPGISHIVVHAHDGSLYAASLGATVKRATDPAMTVNMISDIVERARVSVTSRFMRAAAAEEAALDELSPAVWDTVNRVLHRIGLTDYVTTATMPPHVEAVAERAANLAILGGSNVGLHRNPIAVGKEEGLAKVLAQSAENSRAKRPAGEGGRSDSAGSPGVVDGDAGGKAEETGLGGLAERKPPLPPAAGAPLFGEAPRQQTPRPAAEPTIRSDERQAVMSGMGPSAVQAQAARDQAGRGGLLPSGEQRPANEGLFAPPKPDQKPLFGRGVKPITAYHGSPHDFDRFDISKIGIGEGAQSFGHGLYFTEREAIARHYRDKLSREAAADTFLLDGQQITRDSIARNSERGARGALDVLWQSDDVPSALSELRRLIAQGEERGTYTGNLQEAAGWLRANRDRIELKSSGKMYETRLHLDPDKTLNWDRPLSEQPPGVQAALEKLPETFKNNISDQAERSFINGPFDVPEEWTGGQFLKLASHHNVTDGPDEVAEHLRNAGIEGIRYLDQGSRRAGEGTSNYVVFDDKLIDIERKFGRRGADAAGAPPFQRGAMAGHPDYPHPAAIQAVIDAARHMTGNHIQIEAYDAAHHAFMVKFPDGHTEQVFGYALGRLIRAAIEPGRFAQNMNHEALHALKRLGVFTPREWATLEAAAEQGGWIDKHGVKERYPELDHAGHLEEAIADEMGERSTADRVPGATPSFMARMLAKVRTFLARLRNLMRGHGFQTVDDVFGKIMRGEVGAREPGSGMEQIGPETVEGSIDAALAWGLRDPNELALGRRPVPTPTPATAPPITTPATMVERLERIPRIGHALATVAQGFTDLGHTAQMMMTPMAAEGASHEARTLAKNYANLTRWIAWDYNRIIDWGRNTFKPDRLKAMWDAADADSVEIQTNSKPLAAGHGGVADLHPDEQTAVKAWQADADKALALARKVGMTEAEGLPSYAPRMVVDMVEGVIHPFGQGGDNARAEVVRNMLTLPLATMRLREAIAGRALVNQIKAAGARTGQATVVEGGTPQDFRTFGTNLRTTTPQLIHRKHLTTAETEAAANKKRAGMGDQPFTWFTIKGNPAFWTRKARLGTDANGNFGPLHDENGNVLVDRVPIYVRGDFEGPLKAIMHESAAGPVGRAGEALYHGMMSLKGRMMTSIMYGVAHLGVIAGRAFPAAPNLVRVIRTGSAMKQDPATMRRLILGGLAPIGRTMGFRDLPGMIEDPQLTPGRSWTSKAIAFVPGLYSPKWSDATKRAIDRAGDFTHNTLLWDQVQNIQVGLAVQFEQHLLSAGMDADTATKVAANFANIYAGALPREAMSQGARALANILMFSRSYRLGNLAAVKAAFMGLPRDMRSQIIVKQGEAVAKLANSMARRKGISVLLLDMALYYVGNSLLQSGINAMLGLGQEQDELPDDAGILRRLGAEGAGYARRLIEEAERLVAHPQQALNPFGVVESLSALYDHEPQKRNRILVGFDKDGTGEYMRNPTGKAAEDISDYFVRPLDTMKRMMSPFMRPLQEVWANDLGFGHKVYDPMADAPTEVAQTVGALAGSIASSTFPWASRLVGAYEGHETVGRALGEVAAAGLGTSVSRGYPGGPALGELSAARESHQFQVQRAMPGIRDMIRRGDNEAAAAKMTELGVDAGLQRYIFGQTTNPSISRRQGRDLLLYGTPEQQRRVFGPTTP